MKQITNFIGIDISKNTLDFCLIEENGVLTEIKIDNQEEAIVNTLKSLFEEHKLTVENTLICAEHTGHYTNILSNVMRSKKYLYWLAILTLLNIRKALNEEKTTPLMQNE